MSSALWSSSSETAEGSASSTLAPKARAVAMQILDGLVVGLGFVGTALEQVGMVLLAIITEPAFWEILRICVEVACCFGGS